MKRMLKRVAVAAAPLFERCLSKLLPHTYKNLDLINSMSQQSQRLLAHRYSSVRDGLEAPLSFQDVEFRAYSQNSEDGILLYIFSLIGVASKRCVEICAGNGIECNSANLIINHGWSGLMFDGNGSNIREARAFYRTCRDTFVWPPQLVHGWVTAENINSLISEHGFAGEIDLLSLDVDGVDYWIWKSLEVVNARVVVLEYNHLWGPTASVTVPYRPDFKAEFGPYGADYSGASLRAFVKLGKQKGYRLVGTQHYGTNGFFVRDGIGEDLLPEIAPEQCFNHPRARFGIEKRFPLIAEREWIVV